MPSKNTNRSSNLQYWGLIALSACLLAGAVGCASPKYVHAVFFTCKPDVPACQIDSLVADGYDLLGQVPTVRRVESGRRDTAADRDVNDQDYDVGLVVYFDDKAGLEAYIEHPTHIEYVEKHEANWAKVRVFDFITP